MAATELGLLRRARERKLLAVRLAPALLVVSVALAVASGSRSPTRLVPARSWAPPSSICS